MSERLQFVGRLLAGDRMTDACRAFGISRKTGYKIWNRFLHCGADALVDASRRPTFSPNRTPDDIVALVVAWRKKHPTWGPKKLRAEMRKQNPGLPIPAASTIGDILTRANLTVPRRRRRHARPSPGPLGDSTAPNQIWSADFKGQFRIRNQKQCFPLTVSDHFSRFLLCCEALENTQQRGARAVFEETFAEHGLPEAIRVDNGVPFSSTGLAGLTQLSAWWVQLGIRVERIAPGHPEQNGRHERMHLTLKQEATRPPVANMLQQQERFDAFRHHYNEERPHEALDMRYPVEVHERSPRQLPEKLEPLTYPLHDVVRPVKQQGDIYLYGCPNRRCFISQALAGQHVGLRELEDSKWLVTFAGIDLGHIDQKSGKLIPDAPHMPSNK